MNAPSRKPRITFEDFFFYVVGTAVLAGLAIYENPTWPVVIGILALCTLCAFVFCFAWSRGFLESDSREHAELEEEENT